MAKYINYGIDLGTTNSCISRWEGDTVRTFQNTREQMYVTPSAIRITKAGRIIVGKRAYESDDDENVAVEFKRWMGQKDKKKFIDSGREMNAEELSAEILKSLKEDAFNATGEEVKSAVITVPAAFGSQQCEATANAAKFAGIENSLLLQEPIAAACAYGFGPGAKDQHWVVFDLGGGTFDVAVVSTNDNRLSVLEHRGDNHLGGKEIDRELVEQIILKRLSELYAIPNPQDGLRYRKLFRKLVTRAEDAKKELSSVDQIILSIFEVGEDLKGKNIEVEIPMKRAEVERITAPIIDRCIRLTKEAIEGARISHGDIDRIVLVGGPTQMPVVRQALQSEFGKKIEHSLDPMTIVSVGAAVYASSVELGSGERTLVAPITAGKVPIMLAFDPVSPVLKGMVEGKIECSSPDIQEIRVDAEGGFWTSGWVPVTKDDKLFDVEICLRENKSTKYKVSARDSSGRIHEVEPSEFSVRHGMVSTAPPLPHTISVETANSEGKIGLTTLFPKGTPLPIEKTFTFRANKTLKPNEPGETIAIKMYEGEDVDDIEANDWIGNLVIRSQDIDLPIPEGSDIELNVKVDISRLVEASAFIPRLNVHFTKKIYASEITGTQELMADIPDNVSKNIMRLGTVKREATDRGNIVISEEADHIEEELYSLDVEADKIRQGASTDPDMIKKVDGRMKELRRRIARIEQQLGVELEKVTTMEEAVQVTDHLNMVDEYGTDAEKKEAAFLKKEYNRVVDKADLRGIKRVTVDMHTLIRRVLWKHPGFLVECLERIKEKGDASTNPLEAERWHAKAEKAIEENDSDSLRIAIIRLYALQKPDMQEEDFGRMIITGIRK